MEPQLKVETVCDPRSPQTTERPALGFRLLLGSVFLAYFAGTAILYFVGPWHYPMEEGQRTFIAFLVAVHIAFAAGYAGGIRAIPARAALVVSVNTIVLAGVVAELLLLFPTSAFSTGSWIPLPWSAIQDLGAAYTMSLTLRDSGTPYVHYVRIIIAPLLAAAVPLGVFYWNTLGLLTKVLLCASVAGTIALSVAMGANVGAAQWMVIFPWLVVASHLAGVHRLSLRGWMKLGAVQVLAVVLFLALFSATMVQRRGSFAKRGYMEGITAEIETEPAARASRSAVEIGADGLAAYMTHGYFAVYLSLQEPFEPCYGVGNSVFLQRQLTRLTGNTRFVSCSYPARIQSKGWNATNYWATIYPWIASDVTFPGTVLVILLIGWVAGRVWLDVLGGRNPVAVAFFGQLLVMLYYFPAHNKIFHGGETAFAFCSLFLGWLLTRCRKASDR